MERINIAKNSIIREILLSGLPRQGYRCAGITSCPLTPVSLYYNKDSKTLALYRCGLSSDELIVEQYSKPDRLKVIISEYRSFNDKFKNEIADLIEQIADGSFFDKDCKITYL